MARAARPQHDTRGHGGSGVAASPTPLKRLGGDLLALLDHLDLPQAPVCGLSLGGPTAQWLAIYHPDRVERLVLSNTAARIGSVESWDTRIAAVATGGMDVIAEAVLARFFSPAFRATNPETVPAYWATLTATDPSGYVACCTALRDADLRPLAGRIVAPTLVVAGELDDSTPPEQARELRGLIAGSELIILDGAAHLASVEQPETCSALLRRFLLT